MKNAFLLIVITTLLHYNASAQTPITTKNALKHIGEMVTVYGKVDSVKLINASNTALLVLGEPDQTQYLTVVIKGTNGDIFKNFTKVYYKGTNIRATGKIVKYKDKPELIINDPTQLKVNLTDNIVRIPADRQSWF